MFNRDQDAGAEDQTFPWPPPGFRERRSHFGRTPADPASTSSPFGNPHRKSSDQVIQSLRDELDKHRQMFFDRLAPQWEPTGHRQSAGFPFTDSGRRPFSAMDRTMPHHQQQHHPHQHPSYAFHQDDIPAWMTEDDVDPALGRAGNRQRWPSSGSGRSAGSNSSAGSSGPETVSNPLKSAERSDSPSRPRIHKPAARSATGDFPAGSPAASSPKGFCRASSAPPVAPHLDNDTHTAAGSPRRLFTTTVHHQPSGNQHQPTNTNHSDSPGSSRRHPPNSNGGSSSSASSHVRHIPIMVEGRDEPLLPSVAEESAQSAAEKRSKTAIPMPFYPTPSTPKTTTTIKTSTPIKVSSSPSVDHKKEEEVERDGSIPIPLPYDRLSDDSGKSVGSTASADTANDLQLIERIQRETESLLPRIEAFRGDRHDRGFLFLDEMLTRLLLKLDNVQIEGRDDVRQARRQAIASITRCINLLESKLLDSIERSNEGEVAAVDKNPQQQDEAIKEETKTEDQTTDAPAEENPVTSPATHVSQLVINIPFQEQNSSPAVGKQGNDSTAH